MKGYIQCPTQNKQNMNMKVFRHYMAHRDQRMQGNQSCFICKLTLSFLTLSFRDDLIILHNCTNAIEIMMYAIL